MFEPLVPLCEEKHVLMDMNGMNTEAYYCKTSVRVGVLSVVLQRWW